MQAIPLPDPARERAKPADGLGGELPSAVTTERLRLPHPLSPGDRPVRAGGPGADRGGLHAVACHHPLTTDRPLGGGVDEGAGTLGSTNPLTRTNSTDPQTHAERKARV
jgi:hypothetical protein